MSYEAINFRKKFALFDEQWQPKVIAEMTRRAAQSADQLLKGIGVFGGVLEPSQEVEWLSKFSAVMQTSRYSRQVFHTNSNVPGLLLEDGSAFILR